MWEAVRKIFRQDGAPEERPTPGGQAADEQKAPDEPMAAPPEVDGADAEKTHVSGATTAAPEPVVPSATGVPSSPSGSQAQGAEHPESATPAPSNSAGAPAAVEVSSPEHAPQGLAAEPAAQATGLRLPDAGAAEEEHDRTQATGDATTSAAEGASEARPPAEPVAAAEVAPDAATSQGPDAAHAMLDEPDHAASTVHNGATPLPDAAPEEPGATLGTGDATAAAATADVQPDEAVSEATPAETSDATAEAPDATVTESPVIAAPLAAGTLVGDRYTIIAVAEEAEPAPDARTYRASDTRSYERCWSCGSGDNGSTTRFCQNCGAPIQDHPVTLVQTRTATGEPGEVEHDGTYFHVQPERRMFGAEGMGIEIGAYSAEGPHHPNEDSYWYVTRTLCANSQRQSTGVVVFADGMGGYAPGSGLISSRIAAAVGKSILAALDDRGDVPGTLDEPEAESIVREAIATTNQMVLDEIAHTGEMGSTLVVVMIHGEAAYVANIGDSRTYYIDPQGRATAITRDQSLVAQEVQQGRLAESDIYTALGNNIILHAVGEADVQDAADFYAQPLEPDSFLLVCSDGYWKTLHGAVLPDGTLREDDTISAAARRMVDDALTQGSDDNTTVLLIAIS